jgi:hypothetical protein
VRVRAADAGPTDDVNRANPHPNPLPEYRAREQEEYWVREQEEHRATEQRITG